MYLRVPDRCKERKSKRDERGKEIGGWKEGGFVSVQEMLRTKKKRQEKREIERKGNDLKDK